MISGRQIRDARAMLGWNLPTLSLRSNVGEDAIRRAEAADGTPSIALVEAARLRQAFERGGVRFGEGGAVMRAVT